jgi:hypothetical protein
MSTNAIARIDITTTRIPRGSGSATRSFAARDSHAYRRWLGFDRKRLTPRVCVREAMFGLVTRSADGQAMSNIVQRTHRS